MNLLKQSQIDKSIYVCLFQCFIRQANISMKFPCTYYIEWSTPNAKSISKTSKHTPNQNTITFQQKIELSTEMLYDSNKQQFLKRQTLIQLFLISKSRPDQNKLVGRVTIDLSKIINFRMYAQPTQFRLNFCSVQGNIIMQFSAVQQKLTTLTLNDLDRSSFIDYISQVAIKTHNKNSSVGGNSFLGGRNQGKSIDRSIDRSYRQRSLSPISKVNNTDYINKTTVRQSIALKEEKVIEKKNKIVAVNDKQRNYDSKLINKVNQYSELNLGKDVSQINNQNYSKQVNNTKKSEHKLSSKLINNSSSNNLVKFFDKQQPKKTLLPLQQKVSSQLFNQNYILNRIRSYSNDLLPAQQQKNSQKLNMKLIIPSTFTANNEEQQNECKRLLTISQQNQHRLESQIKRIQTQFIHLTRRQEQVTQQLRNKDHVINELNSILKQKQGHINQMYVLLNQKQQQLQKIKSQIQRQRDSKEKNKQNEERNLFQTKKYQDQFKIMTVLNKQLQQRLDEELHVKGQYEEKFNSMNGMISALQKENQKMIQKYQKLNQLYRQDKIQMDIIKAECQDVNQKYQELQNEYLLLQSKATQTIIQPTQNPFQNEYVQQLQAQLAIRTQQLHQATKQSQQLLSKYFQLQTSNDQYKQLLDQYKLKLQNQTKTKQLTIQNSFQINNHQKLCQDNNQLQIKVGVLSQALKNYQIQSNQNMVRMQQGYKNQIKMLQLEIARLSGKQGSQTAVKQLIYQPIIRIFNVEEPQTEFEAIENEYKDQISKLKQLIQKLRSRQLQQTSQLKQKDKNIDQKITIIHEYQSQILNLRTIKEDNQKLTKQLQRKLQEINNKYEQLSISLKSSQQANQKHLTEYSKLVKEMESANKTISSPSLQVSMSQYQQVTRDLQQLKLIHEQKCKQSNMIVDRLNKDLEEQINQNNQLSQTIVGYMQKQAKLKQTLTVLQEQSKEIVTLFKQKQLNEQTYKEIINGLNYEIDALKNNMYLNQHQFLRQNISPIRQRASPTHGQTSRQLQSQNNQLVQINEQLNEQLIQLTIKHNQAQTKSKLKISQLVQKIKQWQINLNPTLIKEQMKQSNNIINIQRQRQYNNMIRQKQMEIEMILENNKQLQNDKFGLEKQIAYARTQLLKYQEEKFGIQSANHQKEIRILQLEEEIKRLVGIINDIQANLIGNNTQISVQNNVERQIYPATTAQYTTKSIDKIIPAATAPQTAKQIDKIEIIQLLKSLQQKLLQKSRAGQWQQLIQNTLNKSFINEQITKLLNLQQKSRLLSKQLQKIKSHLLKSEWRNQHEKMNFISLFKKAQIILLQVISSAQSLNLNQSNFI